MLNPIAFTPETIEATAGELCDCGWMKGAGYGDCDCGWDVGGGFPPKAL